MTQRTGGMLPDLPPYSPGRTFVALCGLRLLRDIAQEFARRRRQCLKAHKTTPSLHSSLAHAASCCAPVPLLQRLLVVCELLNRNWAACYIAKAPPRRRWKRFFNGA